MTVNNIKENLDQLIAAIDDDRSNNRSISIDNLLFDLCMISSQLEELAPTAPRFVASWYEEHKDDLDYQIWYEIDDFDNNYKTSRVANWINETNGAIQTLINMHQFGYKVEEVEERYLVKMKGVEENKSYLCYNANGNWLFGKKYNLDRSRTHHTRRELESAGFGNVFDSPLFEVLEVEE